MNYLIKPPKQFFISEEYTSLVPNEIRHFIVWVACQQPRTVYANGNVHCSSNCYRSIDDIYHLVSHKWQISEEEYLNILVELFSSSTFHEIKTLTYLSKTWSRRGVIFLRYCSDIKKLTAVFSSFTSNFTFKVSTYLTTDPFLFSREVFNTLHFFQKKIES